MKSKMEAVLRLAIGLMVVFALAGIMAPRVHSQNKNLPVTLLTSSARTATTVSTADQTNDTWNRVQVIINVSSFTSGTYTPKVQGKDPVSGTYYDLLVGPAIGATGATVLKIGPGFAPIANGVAGDMLPRVWRVTLAGAATPSMTFSVGAFLGD